MTDEKILRKEDKKPEFALGFLPPDIRLEIIGICKARRGGLSSLSEIRLRRGGRCEVTLGREKISLRHTLSDKEADELLVRLSDGALYSKRDCISAGYIPLGGGVRVGVGGTAAYEGGRLVGISDIQAFLFRIPTGKCEFSDKLYEIYLSGIGSGMLIFSPPGVGKTTALRSLASMLGGAHSLSVVIIDERREFFREDFIGLSVDVLSGYEKRRGIEIATRTLSPDIIIIDEIGAEDASALPAVLSSGVPLIASAHAKGFDEIKTKPSLRQMLDMGVFRVFVGISRGVGGYAISVDRL